MSKERAQRRAEREAAARAQAIQRERRRTRERRRRTAAARLSAPLRWTWSRLRRSWAWFLRRSRGQRVLVVVGSVLVVVALVRAETWGTRVLVLGLSALLLPVAWTLVSPRRR